MTAKTPKIKAPSGAHVHLDIDLDTLRLAGRVVTAAELADGADALANGWNPAAESLAAWRERRSAYWRAKRDAIMASGDY